MILKMATRNLFRRKFRTTLLVLALGLSFSVLLFFRGLAEGGYRQMAQIVVRDMAGHVVIEGKGYRNSPKLDLAVLNYISVLDQIRSRHPGLRALPRIFFEGVVKSSSNSLNIRHMIAFNELAERSLNPLHRNLVAGRFPHPGEKGIVLGEVAARRLRLAHGESLLLITQGTKGPVMAKIPLIGILSTGILERDRSYAYLDLGAAQHLLSMEHRVTQIAVYGDITRSHAMASKVNSTIARDDLDILPWDAALPMLAQFITYHNASIWLFQAIIFFIVSIIIMNGLLMAVLERTREFGVLRSIGMSPRHCFTLITAEAALLGILSAGLGLAIGLTTVKVLGTTGLNPTIFTGGEAIEIAGGNFTEKIYPELSWFTVVWTTCALIILAMASAVLPALRAARLHPVKAMRKRS